MTDNNENLSSIESEYHFSYGEPPHNIECRAVSCGRDFIFVFGGGTAYHIGAVAVGLYHPSIKDQSRYTTTASVITLPGHKEDALARTAALRLSRELQTNVTVCVGIHVDNASQADIQKLEENFNELLTIVNTGPLKSDWNESSG